MQPDIFSQLYHQFTLLSPSIDEPHVFDRYLDHFPHEQVREQTNMIPTRFQRWWVVTCIKGHLANVRKLQHLISKNKSATEKMQRHRTALLWMGQAQRLFEAAHFMITHIDSDIRKYRLQQKDLRLGDIVLSYKTDCYLRHSFLSRYIKFATHSAITHVMVACHEPEEHHELLMSDDTTEGIGTHNGETEFGELFLILEPLPHPKLSSLYERIRHFRTIAHLKQHDTTLEDQYGFPEMKCEAACLIGILHIFVGLISRIPISLKNPFENQHGTFCSEFIDSLFASIGIQLLPRSEHKAVIGPVELLYSPYLRIKGVIGDDRTIDNAEQEFREQFKAYDTAHPLHKISCNP